MPPFSITSTNATTSRTSKLSSSFMSPCSPTSESENLPEILKTKVPEKKETVSPKPKNKETNK